ncbi:hypothetical protein EVAR_74865_1 [Eumeta japonica]|uniref:Histone-lysine N-methyltransferase SETMAR n=1 Tax=Eumeta variegata TaxID=151549 RepID=A0A4C1SPI7_EUMVA|nr:hypothetical protein EVAR_74865_1 [Eumeta japonica]
MLHGILQLPVGAPKRNVIGHPPKMPLNWSNNLNTQEMVKKDEKIVIADRRVTKRRGHLAEIVLFHQDNVSAHRSAIVKAAIRDADSEILEHPLYSLDLAPSDFYLAVVKAAIRDAGSEILEHPLYSLDLAPSDFYLAVVKAAIRDAGSEILEHPLYSLDLAPSDFYLAVVKAAIRDAGSEILEHPLYSLKLAPNDFYQFLKLKGYLKGQRFKDDETLIAAVQGLLDVQDEEFFKKRKFKLRKKIYQVHYGKRRQKRRLVADARTKQTSETLSPPCTCSAAQAPQYAD